MASSHKRRRVRVTESSSSPKKRSKHEGINTTPILKIKPEHDTRSRLSLPESPTTCNRIPPESENILHVLPSEILLETINVLDPVAYLALKLTCRTFSQHMPATLPAVLQQNGKTPLVNLGLCVQAHTWIEIDLHELRPHRRPRLLLCTSCCRFLPRTSFSDAEHAPLSRRRERYDRPCFECGVVGHDPCYFNTYMNVGGVPHFACRKCCSVKPTTEVWRCSGVGTYRRAILIGMVEPEFASSSVKICIDCGQDTVAWQRQVADTYYAMGASRHVEWDWS